MDLWLGQKTYWRSPVSHLFCVGEVGVNEKDRVNPEVPMQYMHELEIPLIIQDQMSFRVGLTGTEYFRPEHRMKMWSVLSGLHARGIQ